MEFVGIIFLIAFVIYAAARSVEALVSLVFHLMRLPIGAAVVVLVLIFLVANSVTQSSPVSTSPADASSTGPMEEGEYVRDADGSRRFCQGLCVVPAGRARQ